MHSLLARPFLKGITSPSLLYSIVANLTVFYANQNLDRDQITNPNPTPRGLVLEYDYIIGKCKSTITF